MFENLEILEKQNEEIVRKVANEKHQIIANAIGSRKITIGDKVEYKVGKNMESCFITRLSVRQNFKNQYFIGIVGKKVKKDGTQSQHDAWIPSDIDFMTVEKVQ